MYHIAMTSNALSRYAIVGLIDMLEGRSPMNIRTRLVQECSLVVPQGQFYIQFAPRQVTTPAKDFEVSAR